MLFCTLAYLCFNRKLVLQGTLFGHQWSFIACIRGLWDPLTMKGEPSLAMESAWHLRLGDGWKATVFREVLIEQMKRLKGLTLQKLIWSQED